MKSLIAIILLSTLSCIFVRCTIEKRLYNKGFHIDWNRMVHSTKETENSEKKNESAHTQFTASTFTLSDSVILIQEKLLLSEDSSGLTSNIHKVIKNETEKGTNSSSDKETKIKSLKKEKPDETRAPVNKKALVFALILGAIVLIVSGIMIFEIVTTGSSSLVILAAVFAFPAMILFILAFNKPKTKDQQENPKPSDSERKLAVKKNSAIIVTFIGLFAIGLAFLGLMSAVGAGIGSEAAIVMIGSFFSGLIGFLLLLIAAALWSNYHDAQKDSETYKREADSPPRSKVKGRGWILLGILGFGLAAVLLIIFVITKA